MSMHYSIIFRDDLGGCEVKDLLHESEDEVLKEAAEYLRANPTKPGYEAYLEWYRDSDGCVGYLDRHGNASPHGSAWEINA